MEVDDEKLETEDIEEDEEEKEDFDKERAMQTIKNLRQKEKEAKALKKQLDDAQQKINEYNLANMSELDAAKARADEAEKKVKELQDNLTKAVLQQEVLSVATELGFSDISDALIFLDLSKVDEDRKNIKPLLKELLNSKPYLKGTTETKKGPPATGERQGVLDSDALYKQELDALRKSGKYLV